MFYIISILVQIFFLRLIISFFSSFFRGERKTWSSDDGQRNYYGRTYSDSSLALAYQTLGVSPDSTDVELKSAYRQ
ncbi:MAG: hypothetical protein ACI3ZK_02690, partial [Candidatus Cryptobacteroides sp.]